MTIVDGENHPRVWATLITGANYLPGVLTLNYSLVRARSKYPLVALYTDKLDRKSLEALHKDKIATLKIEALEPCIGELHLQIDSRFIDTWTKLYVFKLYQFKRIVHLDSDMLVLQNMDELMEMEMGDFKFASTHACLCNPYRFKHYPPSWNKQACVYTYHDKHMASRFDIPKHMGPSSLLGLSKLNSGILVVEPSVETFDMILDALQDKEKTCNYKFPDQDLLADVFYKKWLSISYIYNCLKTFKNCHSSLWDLSQIKNIHYILSPKPWDVDRNYLDDSGTFEMWWNMNDERLRMSNSPCS